MSSLPWVRFFPSDWLAGTRGMSAAETGVYISLIAMMYERGEPLAEDPARLARLCGASNSQFQKALESLLSEGKIVRLNGCLWNDRVEKEQVYRSEKSEVGKQAAEKRWRKDEKKQSPADANAMRRQCQGNANQKPEPDTSEPSGSSTKRASAVEEKAAIDREFTEVFWPAYPEKAGKAPALKAWAKARKSADVATIMAGLDRYIAAKPPDRSWMHPATFLNNSRWEDQYPARPTGASHERSYGRQQSQHDDIDAAFANIAARRDVREPSGSDRERPFAPSDSISTRELSLDRGEDGSFGHRGFRPELVVGRR